ncbi:hypothetical protein V2J09_002772 [Rumex salicifolius]
MHDPRAAHLLAMKRILRYVKGIASLGLTIAPRSVSQLNAYSDVDWADCLDSKRSTSGYCVFLGPNLISWSYKRQPTVSRSSVEAEYRAVVNAIAEACWLSSLVKELSSQLSSAIVVFCDNVSVVYMSSNPIQHHHTKHIEIDVHFVREKNALGEAKVLHVPTSRQFADIFTKGLPSALFNEFRDSLCLSVTPTSTARVISFCVFVEAIIGVLTAVVALFSAAVTLPCWAPLFSTDATRTTELLKGKKETLRLLIKDLKPKKNGVFIKQVSALIADSDALLDQLDNSKIPELEERIEQKCTRSEMDEQLIPKLKTLIQKAVSIISKGNPCRGYSQSREIWGAVSSPEKPKVTCIHGALGVGKTAMAKCIHNRALNDENEELFRYVVWVDVEYGADVYKVQEFIAKSLDILLDDSSSTVERASKLENALLEMDNFLLVLDSMWKPMSLKEIGIPELVGKRKRALMAELDGLPLAIIKFALALGNTHGEQINSSDVHDKFGKKPFYLQGTDQELLNHFNGSYLDLDENLRPCFMYCALFPKGHVINAK